VSPHGSFCVPTIHHLHQLLADLKQLLADFVENLKLELYDSKLEYNADP
jgi:hypothetical protein